MAVTDSLFLEQSDSKYVRHFATSALPASNDHVYAYASYTFAKSAPTVMHVAERWGLDSVRTYETAT